MNKVVLWSTKHNKYFINFPNVRRINNYGYTVHPEELQMDLIHIARKNGATSMSSEWKVDLKANLISATSRIPGNGITPPDMDEQRVS